MPDLDLVIHADQAVVDGRPAPYAVGVAGGRVVVVQAGASDLTAAQVVRLGPDQVLLPGLVDTHVHLQDPGNTEWEDFDSATRAAAAGGITTLVDMPLDSVPVTVSLAALEVKRRRAQGRVRVDVGFWAGVTPTNLAELAGLHRAGVMGFKCFLANTGLPEYPPVDVGQMRAAMAVLAQLDALLIVHAEDAGEIERSPEVSTRSYLDFLASRPKEIENVAIAAVIDGAMDTGARAHILHLSSSDGVGLLARAQRDGVRVSAETCPHYLALTAEEVPDGATEFKTAPPIREAANADLLWRGLADRTVSMVVSDHSPCTPDMKHVHSGDFAAAFGGGASLQITLPIVWTAARARGFGIEDVVSWMSTGPAALTRMQHKGRIAPGYDADFCVLAPEETFVVDPGRLHHKQPLTAFAGRTLHGVVQQTWLHGELVDDQTRGRLLTRDTA
jgi:allantoinase